MSDYAGVVIFGGPMSANDCGTLAGIKCELDWIPKVVEAGVPYLGLCLGAQLLTRAVGGKVGAHPEGKVEIGYVDIEPTEAGRAWFAGPMKVYQWHREGMTCPRAASCWRPTNLSGAGLPLRRRRLRLPVPSRGDARDEAHLDASAVERLKLPGAQQRGVHLSSIRSTIRRSIAGSTAPSTAAGQRPARYVGPAKPSTRPTKFSPPNNAFHAIEPPRCMGHARPNYREANEWAL